MSNPKFRSPEEESLYRERQSHLEEYRVKWGSCYPHQFTPTMSLKEYRKQFDEKLGPGEILSEGESVRLVGRIKTKRQAAKKLAFYTLEQDGTQVQFLVNFKMYGNPDHFPDINHVLKMGDQVGAVGVPGKSKKGELSLFVSDLQLLAPCLYTMPRDQFGLKDPELRVRDRHVDLLVTSKSRRTFLMAHQLMQQLRQYMYQHNFLEVRTPVLSSNAGGASAKPFLSHHNELDLPVYMRVAPELYLKSLVVGGLNRVFELGPQFRNEGVDTTHNPEFWTLEFYEAYADYRDLMKRTEDLFSSLAEKLTGGLKVKYLPLHKKEGEEVEIDFTPPYRVIPIVKTLEQKTGMKFPPLTNSSETITFLEEVCESVNVDCPAPKTAARMVDRLVGELIEPECVNPTFLTDHPQVMSPLAKWHRDDPSLSERFELFAAGMELANAYTELNDPHVQEEMFKAQMDAKAMGDDEAQEIDHHYVRTLSYGLPPTAGFGAGFERLLMLFSNNCRIQDVILFPVQPPKKQMKKKTDEMDEDSSGDADGGATEITVEVVEDAPVASETA